MNTALEKGIDLLQHGELIVITDDMSKHTSYLTGIAGKVTPNAINKMIKVGKGLTYVCIPESKAKQLELPLMVKGNISYQDQDFTVSVDYKSTTTGISTFERADTIKAFTDSSCQPDDFRRPGHIFPLIGKEQGLLERVDIVEASIDLARACSVAPVAYVCEILNDSGEIAVGEELLNIAAAYGFHVVKFSEIMSVKNGQAIQFFSANVIQGRKIGRKIGFPTANLDVSGRNLSLERGAYGVKVRHNHEEYNGMMSVGVRPTFEKAETMSQYEVHIFDFDKDIYGKTIEVDTLFYIREETSFPTVEHLVSQLHEDKKTVLQRMEFMHIL